MPLVSRLISCSPRNILESLCLLRFRCVSLLLSGSNFEKILCCFLISAISLVFFQNYFFQKYRRQGHCICFLLKFRISKLRVFVTRQLSEAMVILLLLFADSTIKSPVFY
jgi:hypothetical protein